MHTALATTGARGLAEFYRQLLGLHYRPGDEPPTDGDADADWWCSWTRGAAGFSRSRRSSG